MRRFGFILLIFTLAACFSQAQNNNPVPLLGSKQNIEISTFCKKYKCKLMPRENGIGYILELPGDETWADIIYTNRLYHKNTVQLWSEYRTIMRIMEDRKTGQLAEISFTLRENFRSNLGTYIPETIMLADAIYYAVGKRLPLDKSGGELYSRDVNDCFLDSRAFPEENYNKVTRSRAMLTGEITLQVAKKKAKYRVACSASTNGSTPKMYSPAFWIEIPSITDLRSPGDK